MAKKSKNAISPTRADDYPEWYQQVVRAADLAELSPVRGCMVIKPWGYALWENMQKTLDAMFKATGHENAYFPLFIPMSYLEREAEHVEGFAKECAVVTHHRLEPGPDGGLVPAGKLEEPLIVRPTSETIIGEVYSKWVQSYRDLPILINQWANVVRWELRPRLFLRTAEFLWQEGHTVHATSEEAVEETLRMLDVYAEFAEQHMAMPVIKGAKTPDERFPGAVDTYTIEAMMQDGKALQSGTSHFMGQNFARSCGIQYLSEKGEQEFAWTTSWGMSTRLIGGLVMTHSDDDGLVLPPRLAPRHVVILPILRDDGDRAAVLEYCQRLEREIADQRYDDAPVRVQLDARDIGGGEKAWQHVKRGVPIRLEVGPRDMANDAVFMARRDRGTREKESVPREQFVRGVADTLAEIQASLLERARAFRAERTRTIDSLQEFEDYFGGASSDGDGDGDVESTGTSGFALAHWAEDPATSEALSRLKVTARCIPNEPEVDEGPGRCIFSGKESARRVVFAKAY